MGIEIDLWASDHSDIFSIFRRTFNSASCVVLIPSYWIVSSEHIFRDSPSSPLIFVIFFLKQMRPPLICLRTSLLCVCVCVRAKTVHQLLITYTLMVWSPAAPQYHLPNLLPVWTGLCWQNINSHCALALHNIAVILWQVEHSSSQFPAGGRPMLSAA